MPHAPYFIVLNAGSGHEETAGQRAIIEGALSACGRPYQLVVVEDPSQLQATARQMLDAARAAGGTIVAAGGDGTINTVAGMAVGSGCPFGVLPQGTFNYFARTHGIPEDLGEAVAAMLSASVQAVQVGVVNERIFLVNASIGLYPHIIEEREADKKQFGRSRLVALLSMVKTALGASQYLHIVLATDGTQRKMRTPMLFIGNNSLQIGQLGLLPLSAALEDGKLAAIAPRSVGKLGMIGLMLRGALGRLGDAANLVSFGFGQMTVKQVTLYGRRRRIKVALDGEVALLDTPLRFSVITDRLLLLKPASEQADVDEAGDERNVA